MKAEAGNQRHLCAALRVAVGLAVTVAAATLACGGDDKPSGDAPTPPEADGGTSVVPPGVTISPEVTPTHIEIRGQQVPLAPGMTYGPGAFADAPFQVDGTIYMIQYDSNRAEPGDSLVLFDSNFTLLHSKILPEDQDEFQPVLDALAGS